MIICIVDDTEKMQYYSVGAWLFVQLNEPSVLNLLYLNDTSLVAITPKQVFCLMYIICQQNYPSHRFWNKVNFKRSLTGLNSEFSFS